MATKTRRSRTDVQPAVAILRGCWLLAFVTTCMTAVPLLVAHPAASQEGDFDFTPTAELDNEGNVVRTIEADQGLTAQGVHENPYGDDEVEPEGTAAAPSVPSPRPPKTGSVVPPAPTATPSPSAISSAIPPERARTATPPPAPSDGTRADSTIVTLEPSAAEEGNPTRGPDHAPWPLLLLAALLGGIGGSFLTSRLLFRRERLMLRPRKPTSCSESTNGARSTNSARANTQLERPEHARSREPRLGPRPTLKPRTVAIVGAVVAVLGGICLGGYFYRGELAQYWRRLTTERTWPPRTEHEEPLAKELAGAAVALEVPQDRKVQFSGMMASNDGIWLPSAGGLSLSGGVVASQVGRERREAEVAGTTRLLSADGQNAVAWGFGVTNGELIVPDVFAARPAYALSSAYAARYHADNIGTDLTLIRLEKGDSLPMMQKPSGGFCLLVAIPGTEVVFADGRTFERRLDGWYLEGALIFAAPTRPLPESKPPPGASQFRVDGLFPLEDEVQSDEGTYVAKGLVTGSGSVLRDSTNVWVFGGLMSSISSAHTYGKVRICQP